MATTSEIIARLESAATQLETIATIAVEDTAAEFAKLNTDQMYKGETSEDQKITPSYKNLSYAKKKNQMNSGPGLGIPDLKLTGAFYKGYRLQVINGEIVEDSDVSYAPALEKRYGPKIYGLDPENKKKYISEFLAPAMRQLVSQDTGLKTK